ncbi:homoserine kinase [Weissella tructae]|uniref:Homoserine kinase n=2 Tax=Weissella TaxID=46255 RepID=A0A075TZR8_9LACO|nr:MULTISPECIES: homoserine kinase [Weissella]AIG65781.1 Homoserine kinase [Weissella tructae]AIM63160.1 Homoserine kinase [Weissella ceti]AIM64496.1 Homoserine kinase [Weissella ceti]ELA06766.1 homoserine kinase [Weissella ceti NC36]QVV90943.1 homoserine kinase [Weissella tructae]
MEIKVPATIGDFGPGKASIGFALDLWLTVTVLEESAEWHVVHDLGETIPHDETNYIVAVAKKLVPTLTPHKLSLTSDIPLQRGLGSSTAALMAAIELADQLGGLGLDDFTKLTLAARTETQPANVTATLLGGITTSYLHQGDYFGSQIVTPAYEVIVYQPTERIDMTNRANELSMVQAIDAAAAGNMLFAAWQSNQYALAGQLLENDSFNDVLSLDLTPIRQATHALDVFGTNQFGNHGSIAILVAPEKVQDMLDVLAHVEVDGTFSHIAMAASGTVVTV